MAPTQPKATFPLLPDTANLQADWALAAAQPGCTVLDIEFGQGLAFHGVVQAWQSAVQRPRMLHYVGMLPSGTTDIRLGALDAAADSNARTGLDDGFHRIVFDAQQVSLTLCIGEALSVLSELRFYADHVFGGIGCAQWDRWWVKALARCCRRGTVVHFPNGATPPHAVLQEGGFEWSLAEPSDRVPDLSASAIVVYAPRWELKTSRQQATTTPRAAGRCAVVGAGLSGAAVAQALALRGWQVDVYDHHTSPAQGASGLPVGLVVPHVSADDSPRSRLSRRGTRLTLAHAQRLLRQGEDWQHTGVLEQGATPLWHARAGWVKPAHLVRAWLTQANISWTGSARVASLQHAQGHWLLLDSQAQALGRADVVVLANAHGCVPLIQGLAATLTTDADLPAKLAALQQLHGTLSMGIQPPSAAPSRNGVNLPGEPIAPRLPDYPVNGNGSFVPGVPGELGTHWYAGATYEKDPERIADLATQHRANAGKLLQLLPDSAHHLMPAFAQGAVRHWSNTRCVTHDRMPLVGPVDSGTAPSVWMCVGMGSRGLSFAALCAQLLVAQMGAEPWPVEASLARSLQAHRVRRGKR